MVEETAEYYLRNAANTLEKAKQLAASGDIKTNWLKIFTLVKFASQDITNAKTRDPMVEIDIGPVPTTPHSLARDLTLFEGQINTTEGLPEKTIQSGVKPLLSYLRANPEDTAVRLLLTNVYLRLCERDNAIEQVNAIRRYAPANNEAREYVERFRDDPKLGLALSSAEPFYSNKPKTINILPEPISSTWSYKFPPYIFYVLIIGMAVLALLAEVRPETSTFMHYAIIIIAMLVLVDAAIEP